MRIKAWPATAADCDRAAGFLQSGFWGAFKAEFGWRPRHFLLETEDGAAVPLLMLERGLGLGCTFAYVPHGPELAMAGSAGGEVLAAVAEAVCGSLGGRCLFIRFDPAWLRSEEIADGEAGGEPASIVESQAAAGPAGPSRPPIGAPLRRAAADIQPPDTVILGLEADEEALLAGMKPKWRYNIRLAEKRGVAVEEAGSAALGDFYRLYETTAARDRIALHPRRYYQRLFELAASYEPEGHGLKADLRLWIARFEGEALAAIVTLFRGGRATYLYGASSDERRNLMPAYALQWAAIRAAKAAGCAEYDFFGIPPTGDPNHPMAGLYRFKTGFGGRIAHRAGSWDYPLRTAAYAAFRAAEAARNWYFKDYRKRVRAPRV